MFASSEAAMTRRSVPSALDWTALAALEHAPRSRAECRRAARDLLARGFGSQDVARALGTDVRSVLELLAESEDR